MKYNTRLLITLLMFTLSLPFGLHANDDCDAHCLSEGQWHVAIAAGAGYFDSPLTNVNDGTSLTVLSDIAWYGENAYFDNTELGYTHFTDSFEIDFFLRLNPENWLYQQSTDINLLPVNTFASSNQKHLIDSDFIGDYATGDDLGVGIEDSDQSDKPPQGNSSNNTVTYDRKWAGDIGLRVRYATGKSIIGIFLAQDITAVYNGYSAGLNYRYTHEVGNWTLNHVVSATFKSQNLVEYYYGVGDTAVSNVIHLDSDWFYSLNSTASKPINADWQWLLMASATQLPDLADASPIIDSDSTVRLFAGVSYAF